ncbi:high affinity cAMP-specific and IBMX-insensitive 3',5'-cyclic phosphodiesterase 8 isoform X3 [Photinus pyralis]|uniref:high affinity cAMP-specific and IBMX-insensitive 3',5'-cyclic phosphodiesterase 8 isoform X3 n=1 Tax=Photinus pyralis TaxID=7054 RepID=UPI0012671DAC|nr:high affinity cAMP-specific and IBMX-insensitive 3',5'-cyclic phosphodiesterase 8 isoform X3 [Photinus pyralis]
MWGLNLCNCFPMLLQSKILPKRNDFVHRHDVPNNFDILDGYAHYKRRVTVQFHLDVENFQEHTSAVITTQTSIVRRSPPEIKYGLLIPPNHSPLKLLVVCAHPDPVSEALSKAADKLGYDVTTCHSYEEALEEFLSKLHDLIVIDARYTSKALDYDTLCRSIRNTRGSQHTAAVALVKRSVFDKDDVTIMSLLDAGFNRCIAETTNIVHFVNELIQIRHGDIRPLAQTAVNQSLYIALEKCSDIVLITDDSYRLQYVNRSSERFLGYRYDELLGKSIHEQFIADPLQVTSMTSSLMRAREWQGSLLVRKKSQDTVSCNCKGIPIICAGRVPTHFVLILDVHGITELTPTSYSLDKPRGSVQSNRRTSMDVRSVSSDYFRRTSLAKLSALPLEAPITKVISLLSQAQEQTNPNVVSIIDKVIEILNNTELYSPHLKDDLRLKCDEPVTSDLITALLMQQPQIQLAPSSRRSSNDSTAVRNVSRGISKVRVPAQIKDLLDTSLTWEFDIFRLEELTNKKPLIHLGMNLFLHFDVPATLNCDEKTLQNWLTVIEMNYHVDNFYHNSTHAADVMQATAGFLEKDRLKAIMDPLDEASSLIAACSHDVDHPGKSSAFLSNCDNPLAILYNDVTVLENHHAALTFKLTLGDDRINIFKHLDRETYKVARHNVIDMILATEMTKHFEHLAKFVNVFCQKTSRVDGESSDYIPITLPDNITLVKRMMIKCADVSNPTRPLRLCVEWARRIAEEYFAQTDEEKSKGLPVVMPMFDRITCSIPKSQIGFVDYIVHDMFEAWDAFIDMPELVTYMRQNYIRWKEFDEEGHNTSSDIRKLQNTILMAPAIIPKSSIKRND